MPDDCCTREYEDGDIVPGTPYRVGQLLGIGGMGSVYAVEHIELGRRHVLKSLLRPLASRPDLIARMRNEWRALGKLRHPNIVDVVNAGVTPDGVPYFVMELLEGETVRDRLARFGKFAPLDAVRIAQGALVGLAAAHAIGVVHRDVKPANVFLTKDGGVKLLDFGVAQMKVDGAPKITAKGLAIGTPRYMSPEQAAGEEADARSDVYAVGLLLYEMITGEGPFDDLAGVTQQMLAHLQSLPRPIGGLAEIAPGLEDVISRALAKDPASRPRSARHFAAELAPFAEADAGPDGMAERAHGSLTPPGTVVSMRPPTRVELGPVWLEPTKEVASRRAGDERAAQGPRRLERWTRWWPAAANLGLAALAGAAAFGFGARAVDVGLGALSAGRGIPGPSPATPGLAVDPPKALAGPAPAGPAPVPSPSASPSPPTVSAPTSFARLPSPLTPGEGQAGLSSGGTAPDGQGASRRGNAEPKHPRKSRRQAAPSPPLAGTSRAPAGSTAPVAAAEPSTTAPRTEGR